MAADALDLNAAQIGVGVARKKCNRFITNEAWEVGLKTNDQFKHIRKTFIIRVFTFIRQKCWA